MTNNKPAILGNRPIFDRKVNIVRPLLPNFADLAEGAQNIFASGMLTKGRYLQAFEVAVAEHLGTRHAVAVSSCTAGLMLTYQGLRLTGDVIVPSFTFMATVSALIWAGLRPIFVDVEDDTTNLDPVATEAAITPQTQAIVAVHNFGNPANIDALQAVADRSGLKLIFDAAHGFGALYQGAPVGGQGQACVFSMSPTKLLITGEGGIVATNDNGLAERIRAGREYGNSNNYNSTFAGINARMPEFNALLGLYSLPMLETAANRRNEVASFYQEELGRLPGIGFQEVHCGNRNSYGIFSITVDPDTFGLNRDELALALAAELVDTRKYYDPPVHRQTAYHAYDHKRPLPHTEQLSARSLSLPLWSNMPDEIVLGICHAVQRIHDHARAVQNSDCTAGQPTK